MKIKTKTHIITQEEHSDGISQLTEKKRYVCDWCSKIFYNIDDIKKHLQKDIDDYDLGISIMIEQIDYLEQTTP